MFRGWHILKILFCNNIVMKRIFISASFFTTQSRTLYRTSSSQSQLIHTTSRRIATPLPITATGPPPAAPVPTSQHGDKVDRRRQQADLIRRGQELRATQTKPNAAMKKRFWKDVSVQTDDGIPLYFMPSVSWRYIFNDKKRTGW